MKNIFLSLTAIIICLLFSKAEGQGYYYIKSTGTGPEYAFNNLGNVIMRGSTVGVGLGDTLSAWQTLPFKWTFYGKPVTGYFISNNGYITFDINAKGSNPNNISLPDTNAPKNAIFALWDDLQVINSGSTGDYLIHNWTYGTAPNRVHVINWFNIHHKSKVGDSDSRFFFSIRLYESGQKNFDIVHDWEYYNTVTTSATVGIQDSACSNGMMIPASPNFVFPALTSDKSDDIVYEYYYGIQPQYDMSVTPIQIPSYLKTHFTIPLNLTIRNLGSQIVNSFTINYSVSGSTPVSQSINSVNILPGVSYNFQTPADWVTPDSEKVYTLTIWATNINGHNDQYTANDSLNCNVQVIADSVMRTSIYEVFTSSTCPPCNTGNANLKNIFDANSGKFTCVKYQMNFPGTGDPYYTSECGDRSTFYGGINSIPRLQVDGEWNGNPNAYNSLFLDSFVNVPAFVNLSARYTVTNKKIEVYPSIKPLSDFNTTNLRLFIAVVENVTHNNVKTNGETEFDWVMKKMIPNSSGIVLSNFKKNTVLNISTKFYTFPGNYTLPPDGTQPINLSTQNSVENFNNLSVVLWIQNIVTKEVLQSTWAANTNSVESHDIYQMSVFPNPVSNIGKIVFSLPSTESVSYEIYNSLGQKAYSSETTMNSAGNHIYYFNVSTFKSGIYIIKLNIGNKAISRTFIK